MIALDPNEVFEITLKLEAGKPDVVPFVCRYMTGRQLIEFDRLTDLANAAEVNSADEIGNLLAALALGKVCRKGQPEADAAATLTPLEMWELANQIPVKSRLAERDRKKSASPQPSDTATKSSTPAAPSA